MTQTYEIKYYQQNSGNVPYMEWLVNLRDRVAIAKINIKLDRVRLGNFGIYKSLGDGVFELKIDYGAGYRLYYAMTGKTVVLLLIGGDKSTQSKDIKTAKRYWENYTKGD